MAFFKHRLGEIEQLMAGDEVLVSDEEDHT
jgi:hypothetical protein